MSGLDKKLNKKPSGMCGFSLLYAAELALGIGAIFGFLAVLALVLMPWAFVLIATFIAVLALATAVVLLTIPANPLSGKLTKTKGELSILPKHVRARNVYRLNHPSRQILKRTVSKKHKSFILSGRVY